MFQNNKITLYIQLLIIFVFGLIFIGASTYFNEIIPANNGLGFDGKHYAELAMNYPDNITKAIDTKYFQRSFPSLIIYSFVNFLNLSSSPQTIILLFSLYNLLLLLLSVFIWNKICKVSNFNSSSNWLGFSALFVSFAALKFPFFYPILTDVTGFTLSMFLVYFFKTNNKKAMLVIMVLSSVSWPSIEYMCLALLAFRYKVIIFVKKSSVLNTSIAFIISFVFVSLAGYLIYRHPIMRGGWHEHTYIVKHGIIPSLLASFVVMFFAFRSLFKKLDLFSIPVFKIFDIKFAISGIVLFIGIDVVINKLAHHYNIPSGYSIRMYLTDILIIGSRQPFCFLVGHFAYFGPLFTICIFRWKKICDLIYQQGWSLFFILIQFVFFMMDSESRHILNYMPFITVLLIQSFDNKISKSFLAIGISLSFVFSKAWISIQSFPTSSISDNYNINFGCYLTDTSYVLLLLLFIATCAIFYYAIKKMKISNL